MLLRDGGGCPQVNKVKQVSSMGHQMSVAGEIGPRSVGGGEGVGPRSDFWEEGR